MKLFIDTGSVAEVEEIARWGVLAGATTNPSLLAKEDGAPEDIIRRICELVDGPTSAEVVSEDADGMVAEGVALRGLDERVVVKVPFSAAGLEATARLRELGHPVNMTLVFSAPQAILAAEAGATYISSFLGRLDDIGIDSTETTREIVEAVAVNSTGAQVLAASIRHPIHVTTAAALGADVATVPGKILRQMLQHPLTASGIDQFTKDWQSRPEFAEWLKGLVAKSGATA
ncbi:transaldolase family protein [Patulibacter brassicae]|jgi:transaldolase|uniref:Transaldolase family protein n=1 Tax=Patulibacter brassicae TaxID=1705717 RepID=A0ABU4VLL2_9ACTN|nr:transaldolase family protein [Patulibacter brassicae]MDX8152742.1 transaldolase family protein [Patulibacter brassicae]